MLIKYIQLEIYTFRKEEKMKEKKIKLRLGKTTIFDFAQGWNDLLIDDGDPGDKPKLTTVTPVYC